MELDTNDPDYYYDPYDECDPENDPTVGWDEQVEAAFAPKEGTTRPASTAEATPAHIAAVMRYAPLTTIRDLLDRPPTDWFLQDMIPDAPVTVLHGSGGSYKSFVALDWALCSANGRDWHGHSIKQGKVLYIVGEGVSGIPQRIKAWAKAANLDPARLHGTIMESPINLYTVEGEMIEALRAVVATLNVDTIFVDTLHKSMAGGDENSSKDIGLVFNNAKRIAGSARLIFLHHKTKTGNSQRGSSSIRDDADVVLSLDRDSSDPLVSNLSPDKVRDAREFEPIAITMTEVDNDDESQSLVVHRVGAHAPKQTARLKIINYLRAEPGTTKNKVCCAIGDSGATQNSWKALVAEEVIYSEVRPSTEKRGPKMVDVWFVQEDKVPFMEGLT